MCTNNHHYDATRRLARYLPSAEARVLLIMIGLAIGRVQLVNSSTIMLMNNHYHHDAIDLRAIGRASQHNNNSSRNNGYHQS